MGRFDGIKKVKVSLRRNSYRKVKRGEGLFDFVVRLALSAVMVLSVMAFEKAGVRACELFRQNYIATYAQD